MRSHNAMEQLQNKFFFSCNQKGLTSNIAKELWRQIESFAGYAFCKAHSASFALLSFQVAYLKVHYPAEFMASVLSNRGGYYSAAVYIQECKRMGLEIKLPSINNSEYEYFGKEDEIQIGFMAIKDLSKTTIDNIIAERKDNGKFSSLIDLFIRTKISYKEAQILIKCGACDCLKQTRPTLIRLLDIYNFKKSILQNTDQTSFLFESFNIEAEVITNSQYSLEEICALEYEMFGYMTTRHPLHFFKEFTQQSSITTAKDIHRHNGKKVKMIGWFMTSKRIKTRNGKIMKFLSLEDLTGTFEAVIFPNAYEKYAEKTMSMGPYILEGKVDMNNGNNLVVEKLDLLSLTTINSSIQKDSSENNYYGDKEKVEYGEFELVSSLNTKILKTAYL